MPRGTDIELGLSLRDEATATWNRFVSNVEAGTAEITRNANETGRLSRFIQEGRKEQRDQNYLFREARNVIGTATFAMVGLSEATGAGTKLQKDLNTSIVAGYSAFQSANFMMSALGMGTGAWGLAIQTILGLGTGYLAFINNTTNASAAANAELRELNRGLDRYLLSLSQRGKNAGDFSDRRITSEINVHVRNVAILEQEIEAIKKRIDLSTDDKTREKLEGELKLKEKHYNAEFAFVEALGNEQKTRRGIISELEREIGLLEKKRKLAETPAELSALTVQLHKKQRALEDVNRWGFKQSDDSFWNVWDAKFEGNQARRAGQNLAASMKMANELRRAFQDLGPSQEELNAKQLRFIAELQSGIGLLNDGITSLGVRADSTVSKAISLVQYALQASEILKQMESGDVGKTGGSLGIFGLFLKAVALFHRGGQVPIAHSGLVLPGPPSRNIPIIARGGETIRTEAQEAALQKSTNRNSVTLNVHFNSPVPHSAWVIESVKDAIRQTGLSVDKLMVDNRAKVALNP